MAKCKYYRLKKQVSYDNGLNWQDVIPYEYIQGAEYEYHSTDCGYVGNLERWINSGTTCEGYDKYNLQVKQTSTDGINWVTTEETQLGSLIELNSEDCGYVAHKKLQLTYNDSTEYDINCNESSELTNSEVSGGTNPISAITSAEIGDCVTSISRAFSGCTNMTVCNIPNSVTSIGYQAFTNCSSLTSCTIGSGVTSIGDSSFYGCSGLTSITIPSGVTNIGIYAFQNCSGLTAITIEATTPPTLGANAFNNTSCPIYVPCESVNTYKNATNWSDYANRIEAIPNSCHSVKFKAWYSDSTTYSAECDSSSALTTADTRAHTTAYSAMTSAIIGDCVTSIGNGVFNGCRSLTSIDIPSGVTSIGDSAFSGCSSLTSIDIPNSVTSIGGYAFRNCSGLTSCTIGSGVTTIGIAAFEKCKGLTRLNSNIDGVFNIPSGVTRIGNGTFSYCSNLTSIVIPNGVTSIGDFAFRSCSGLTNVTIGSGVTSIGGSAFNNCKKLTGVTVNASTPPTLLGNAFNNTNNCPIYVPCESVNTYKAASGWSDYASRIEAIPNSCHSVKFKAWYSDSTTYSAECDASSALTTADTRAHTTAYSAMTSAIIGDCVTSIGESAFDDCRSLTSINIPSGVTSIGYYAFRNCRSLTSCTIGSGVTTIGNGAFRNCSGLTSVNIPNSVTSIGTSAFNGCRSLTSINIPSGVTRIVGYVFRDCNSLTSVTIPNSVTSIGQGAFYNCSSLTEVKIYATTPPTLGTDIFYNTNNCPIYVPAASVEAYKSSWSTYARRIQAIP